MRSERSSIAVGFDAGVSAPTDALREGDIRNQFAKLISGLNYMAPETKDQTIAEAAAHLRLVITRTARRMRQEAGSELRASSASALTTVELHGPLTPSELADIERVKRPTATRILRGLEEEGLVQRTPDPKDGRSALISLSGEGRERLRRLRKRKNAYLARRMRDLDADEVATLEGAAEILERLLEGDRTPMPGEGRA